MEHALDELLGCARGPVMRLAPQTRIATGSILFASCLVAPTGSLPGILLILLASLGWGSACHPPWRVARPLLLLGLAGLLPYFLLVPLIWTREPGVPWDQAVMAPWGVFLRGVAGLIVSASTAMTLTPSALRQGLLALPLPYAVSLIVLQVIQQSTELLRESRRVAAAIAVRGASAHWRTALVVLASLPAVWLRRLVGRAESQARSMELRGYCEVDLRLLGGTAMDWRDGLAMVTALALVGSAAALRWGGSR